MPKILDSRFGYFLVDSWDDVYSYKKIFAKHEMKFKREFWETTIANEGKKIPGDFDELGYEEAPSDLGHCEIMRWARHGSYIFVRYSQEDCRG